MLGNAPADGTGRTADDEIGDAFGLVEIAAVAGCLEGRHQRFRQMHVGILAAVAAAVERLPVLSELLGDRAMAGFPEPAVQDLGDVGKHAVGQRMADRLGGGGGKQHERVAVTLLVGVDRAVIVQ